MGLVIKSVPISDYDKRVTILTKEKGKISAFAKGARRQNSRLMAGTDSFSFGVFKLYPGKNAYNIVEVQIENYFEELRFDYQAAFFGMYFLEVADYYGRENNDEREMLKLLYQSLKALTKQNFTNEFVKAIYEIKILAVNGEFPGVLHRENLHSDTCYAIEYVVASSIEKLYTFTLKDDIMIEFLQIAEEYQKKYIYGHFKSLEVLKNCRVENME